MITAEEALHLAKKRIGNQGEDLVEKINNVIQMVIDLAAVVSGKVDKETGKGLSANDFTDTLKTKLDGIEDGAQVNTVSPADLAGKVNTSDFNLFDVVTPSFTSLPETFYSPYLKPNCALVGNAIELSTPTAGDIDWSVSFASGSITISGTFHGSTATTAKMSIWLPTNTITLTNS